MNDDMIDIIKRTLCSEAGSLTPGFFLGSFQTSTSVKLAMQYLSLYKDPSYFCVCRYHHDLLRTILLLVSANTTLFDLQALVNHRLAVFT